ncbi:hypothetical protein HH212_07915 [Massilia forsythiae]|uniref:Cysteine-rich CWC family protein n=1 Tax=Massilia forsythiae TaxID=2728020 RepID=A0A7Z2VVA1_9BURK|nr:cysteine-rich CWC family protein [Massilia forsythiae]QJD99956.1 hypothetical protein HH212_07915 [Massilia forsythiae]
MSTCTRCGAHFSCAVADGDSGPCWCMALPPLAALPPAPAAGGAVAPGCWCPSCLARHIAQQAAAAPRAS